MGSFDVTGMSNVLEDAAPPAAATQQSSVNADAAAVAREKGWTAPQQYDYSKYNTTVQPLEKAAEGDDIVDLPEWAANAAKYEWRDEFGDIGPPNSELEDMLFRNDWINRTGMKLNK